MVTVSQRDYWTRRHAAGGIAAVGSRDLSSGANIEIYSQLAALFRELVIDDFGSDVGRISVLDLGFGHGHYARVCRDLGVARYVGLDFAAPTAPFEAPGFRFERLDISEPFDFGAFDLVLLLDIAFHVVDPTCFARMLANVRRAAERRVYVTGLFRDQQIAAHVHHRPLSVFVSLGRPRDVRPWRDTLLLRPDVGVP